MNPKLLIVDDDEEIRTQMKWALAKDYEIFLAENRVSAIENFRSNRPSVVLLDLGLPPHPGNPEEGLATLSELLALNRLAKIVIITGQGEKEIALRAIGSGAYDFLSKPVETEELKFLLRVNGYAGVEGQAQLGAGIAGEQVGLGAAVPFAAEVGEDFIDSVVQVAAQLLGQADAAGSDLAALEHVQHRR